MYRVKLAAFHSAQTGIAFHGFSLHSLTGFKVVIKDWLVVLIFAHTFGFSMFVDDYIE